MQSLAALCAPTSAAYKSALSSAVNACEISGLSAARLGSPLVAVPVWQLDSAAKEARLARLAVIAPQLAAAKNILRLQPASAEYNLVRAVVSCPVLKTPRFCYCALCVCTHTFICSMAWLMPGM